MEFPSKITPDLAEVLGLHLGDGCVSRYFSSGHEINVIAFTASPAEYRYYESFVKPTIESTFGVKGHLYLRKDNTTRYHIYSKELVSYFANLGIPIGKKLDASIPRAVLDQGQIVHFVRGFYHAEGSLYKRYSKRYRDHAKIYDNLLVIQIRTRLATLMNQVHSELAKLGILCNRLTEKDGFFTLRINSQVEITRFLASIRPRFKFSISR